jgi:cytochrome P450/ferredoxin-NADP reductase
MTVGAPNINESIPVYDGDFYSDEVILDPYPVYAQLREMGPVVWMSQHNCFAFPRYAETSEALRRNNVFINSKGVSLLEEANKRLVGSTLNSDNPIHDQTRAITGAPLLPGNLKDIEPRLRAATKTLIDGLCARGSFDAVSDFATYLPVTIVAELVGLPNTSPDQMLKWASATFNLFGDMNQRATDSIETLKDLKRFLDENGTEDKLIEGGWARRIFEVGQNEGFSAEQCAQLMRDYINPSLDTTISATGQIIKFLCDHPDQWQVLREDPSLIPNAIEEAVRMASPIRAFTRYVAEDYVMAGVKIPAGSRVMVMYASANRDERHFPDPDRFDVRRDVHDHLGFGQGIHMCMGMHLGRLEMRCLLEALVSRVERIEQVSEAAIAMNNAIRAYSSLPVRVHLADRVAELESEQESGEHWFDAEVVNRHTLTEEIVGIDLKLSNSGAFQKPEPGAHIDIKLPSGLIRQYSLHTIDPKGRLYRIAVLKDPSSRGGSNEVHEKLHPGVGIQISQPRNHFPMVVEAKKNLLLAGGIGITPIKAMAEYLKQHGQEYQIIYFGRNVGKLAFVDVLNKEHPGKLSLAIDGEGFDLKQVLSQPATDTHLYTCGPNGFMDFVFNTALELGWSNENLHKEHFGAEISTEGESFQVEAKRSGIVFEVAPGETIASKLEEQGVSVRMSCQSGVCGTCLTDVIEGMPDHRDLVQTDIERASNQKIAVCCSRSLSKKLVIDI